MLRDEYNMAAPSTERPTLRILPNDAVNFVARLNCVTFGPAAFHTNHISWNHVAGKHRGHVFYACE